VLHPRRASSSASKPQLRLGKPLITLNAAAYWHALRQWGIDDKAQGFGRQLADL
jgi:maleate isomerase